VFVFFTLLVLLALRVGAITDITVVGAVKDPCALFGPLALG